MVIGSGSGSPQPFVVREVQTTPNPNAVKLVLDRPVTGDVPTTVRSAEQAAGNPLAGRLFGIPGVVAVLLVNDFVTLNKAPGTAWPAITRKAKQILSAP